MFQKNRLCLATVCSFLEFQRMAFCSLLSHGMSLPPLVAPPVFLCLKAEHTLHTHLSHPQPLRYLACSLTHGTTTFCAFHSTDQCRTTPSWSLWTDTVTNITQAPFYFNQAPLGLCLVLQTSLKLQPIIISISLVCLPLALDSNTF